MSCTKVLTKCLCLQPTLAVYSFLYFHLYVLRGILRNKKDQKNLQTCSENQWDLGGFTQSKFTDLKKKKQTTNEVIEVACD